jgi:hypothetical protein
MGCVLAGAGLVALSGQGSIFAAGALALIGGGIGLLGLTAVVTGEMGAGWRLLRRSDRSAMDHRRLFGAEARVEGMLMVLAGGAMVAAAYVEQFLPGGLEGNLTAGGFRGAVAVVAGLMFAALGIQALTPPRRTGPMAILLAVPRMLMGIIFVAGGLGAAAIGLLAVFNRDMPALLDPAVRQFFEAT